MQRITASLRFWRQLAWSLAAAGFITAALQIAAPLHAKQHLCKVSHTHPKCPSSSETPAHDADKCSVCQFLFGLSGKTLPPIPAPEPVAYAKWFESALFFNTHCVKVCNPHIIPRAPPV